MGLVKAWREAFTFVDVRTQAGRAEAFKLRHEVFCAENQWYASNNGMEIDHHDFQSHHGLVYHNPTQRAVGTSRIIVTDPHNPSALLPAERYLSESLLATQRVERHRIGEMSRFAIAPEFRVPDADAPLIHPMLGLLAWQLAASARIGLTYWYCTMEPGLARVVRLLCGVRLRPLSPPVECHGTCKVYGYPLAESLAEVKAVRPEVWRLLSSDGEVCFDGA